MRIRTKVFIILICFAGLIATSSAFLFYRKSVETKFDNLREEITAIARGGAMLVEPGILQSIRGKEDTATEAYSDLYHILSEFQRAFPRVECVYIMRKTDTEGLLEFIIDVDIFDEEDEIAMPGEPYDASELPEMLNAFYKASADRDINRDRWGWWLSGYAPVTSDSGETLAILGIDVSADTIRRERELLLQRTLIILIFALVLSMILSYFLSSSLTGTIIKIIDSTKLISKGDYEARITEKRSDELGELIQSVNDMSKNIKSTINKLTTLKRTAEILAVTIELDESLKLSANLALEVLGASRGVIILYDDEKNEFWLAHISGYAQEDTSRISSYKFVYDSKTVEALEKSAGVITLKDSLKDERYKLLSEWMRAVSSGMAVPFITNKTLRGLIFLDIEPEDKEYVSAFVNQVSMSLENARLYHEAIIDGLTKLYVRRYFEIQLHTEVKRVKRFGENLSVMMLDIDHFKKINDRYGHQAGDYVLKKLSRILKEKTREVDIVSRYGGEEMIILLPGSDAEGALHTAERIRESVEGHNFLFKGEKIKVTISAGVSEVTPENLISPDEAVSLADKALYRAKNTGRNRVLLSP